MPPVSSPIESFEGEHRFLSNFWPCDLWFEGLIYPSVEHAYVAAKTLDPEIRKQFTHGSAGTVKRAGRLLQHRPGWYQVRESIMLSLLRSKFGREPLKSRLLKTGERPLIEGNTWHDQIWGSCTCPKHAQEPGMNLLGKLLTQVREEIRTEIPF